jgi:hypothetical protein
VGAVLRQNNIRVMRGGLYKPRTSPYAFQGLGREGIAIVAALKQQYELAFLTEVMECRQIEWLDDIADAFQVGARNMQNYALLTELGRQQNPFCSSAGVLQHWRNCCSLQSTSISVETAILSSASAAFGPPPMPAALFLILPPFLCSSA